VADLEFKTRGYFSGTYNAIGGFIKDAHGKQLYELSGLWNEEMYIKDLTTGKKELLFDASHAKHSPPLARPLEEQGERESQKLWHDTTEAVKRRDQEVATDAKAKIEDMQREEAAKRNSEGVDWHPQLFRRVQGGHGQPEEGEEDLEWIINAKVDGKTPEEVVKQVLQIYAILPGQKPDKQFNIPERTNTQQSAQPSEAPQQQPSTHQSPQPPLPQLQPKVTPAPPPQDIPHLQQGVGNLNLDGPAAHEQVDRSLSRRSGQIDPSNPPVVPTPSRTAQTQTQPSDNLSADSQAKFASELPPSTLLHSNPKQEARRDDLLRRKDSETEETEEFHDAQS